MKAITVFLDTRKFGVQNDNVNTNNNTSSETPSRLSQTIRPSSSHNSTANVDPVTTNTEVTDGRKVIELQSQCLRVIANAIADNSRNRFRVLEHPEFLVLVLEDLSISFGNVDFNNKELVVLFNLISDFNPGSKYLAESELAAKAFTHQLNMVTNTPRLDLSVLSYVLIEILDQENGAQHFSSDIMWVLMKNCYIKILGSSSNLGGREIDADSNFDVNDKVNFETGGKEATLILTKFLEADNRFEEYIACDRERLSTYLKLGMELTGAIQDDPDFPEISRRMLAAMGNIASHESFQKTVPISKKDKIFALFIHLLIDTPPKPEMAIIRQGISCVVFGNLVTSSAKVEQLLIEIPNAVALAMKYLTLETDPYALQGAHLIKNITVENPEICKEVVQRGGLALIKKLVDNKLFFHLRVIGVQIAKNIFNTQRVKPIAPSQVLPLVPMLIKTYKTEDKQLVRNEIILAFDVAVEAFKRFSLFKKDKQLRNLSRDEDHDEDMDDFNESLLGIAKLLIHALYTMYTGLVKQEKYIVDPVISLKASKSLGILSTLPRYSINPEESSSNETFLLEELGVQGIENSEIFRRDVIDLLTEFSSDLVEIDNQPTSNHHMLVQTRHQSIVQSRHESVASGLYRTKSGVYASPIPSSGAVTPDTHNRSYKGVINNLGFLGSQIKKWPSVDPVLKEAANVSIRNAIN